MGRDVHRIHRPLKWPWLWLIQIAATLALGVLGALSLWLGAGIHKIWLWALSPLWGLVSACVVTRLGLLNYAAWLAPPAMEFLAHALIWGYALPAGPVFFCAFAALVGAAAGEVLKRQGQK